MVFKITKETWEKCGVKTGKSYNEKQDIIELGNKMSDIEIQSRHWNIYHIALESIAEKNKIHYKRRKRKI